MSLAELPKKTILCVASYEKGQEFLRECKRQGCHVMLLTVSKLEHANWPRESIDELFHMPTLFEKESVLNGVSHLARTRVIDRIVPLDDYDVEMAATLREHLRVPGMGETTTRYFRDKLAMRVRARDRGVLVPEFVHALNYDKIREFINRVPPPWVLKPRHEASAIGIKKINTVDELWPAIEALGDKQSYQLLEQYVPGDVYHVDAIISEREMVFAEVHQYARPPFDVMHGGGLFMTRTVQRGSADEQALKTLTRDTLNAMGLVRGVTHTEFIKGRDDGRFYFLETAARVGGANIVELVDASTGVNLWAEWAKIEIGQDECAYHVPPHREDYGAVILSLARQEQPDTSAYQEPEIAWRLTKKNHVGFVLRSPSLDRIRTLLDNYSHRFYEDFFASLPAPDKPTS
jgi:hypothetical protein